MTVLADEMNVEEAQRRRLMGFAPRLAVFDAEDYLTLNADVAGLDPTRHFAEHGVWEGRLAISTERRTAKLSRAVALAPLQALSAEALERAYGAMASLSPSLHLPKAAGEADERLAARIVASLDQVGLTCRIETRPPTLEHDAPLVIGAATLFDGAPRSEILERLRGAVVVATAFPAEAAFTRDLPYLLAAGGVAAVELETYALFAALRAPAVWFGAPPVRLAATDPPAHPLVPGLSRAVRAAPCGLPWADRPIDVLALDAASPARSAAWSRMIEGMTRYAVVHHAPPPDIPTTLALRRYLYERSKIVLHLHEGPPTTLGATLAAEVAGTGAVLVTEPSLAHRLLRPGTEYFESSARRMPALVGELIAGDDGAALASRSAEALERALTRAFDPEALGLELVAALNDAREAVA